MAEIIKLHGYIVECDRHAEPLTDSVAIYAQGPDWTHFAKYVNGQWLSKIGEDHDITHASLDQLEGDLYGEVVQILSRATKMTPR